MTHVPSFGSILQFDPAGGTAYGAVGQVQDLQVMGVTRSTIDVTDHDSKVAASGYREFIAGVSDGGECSFTIGFDPTNSVVVGAAGTGILGSFDEDGCIVPSWQCTLNSCTGTTAIWTFDGYPTNFTQSSPVEGQHTADLTIKISGKPTLTVT